MFHTTNPVSKLSKSQQYRATYNLPVLFKHRPYKFRLRS